MKIAGQKNPNAWYRFNSYLKSDFILPEDRNGLRDIIADEQITQDYIQAMAAIASKTGNVVPPGLLTATALAETYTTKGVPLQAWMGKLSYDTYTQVAPKKFKPDNADVALKFGAFLRYVCVKWKFALAELLDIENTSTAALGNKGGVADATKGT